jgi:16S rRNA processing protein RimM
MRALEAGRYYHRQVVGLEVVTESGDQIGVIEEILERPANDVWVSRRGSIEQLIPATRDAVLSVDLEARRVVVADWIFKVDEARDKG